MDDQFRALMGQRAFEAAQAHAVDLATEFGMNAVLVTLRLACDDHAPLASAMLAEAVAEVGELMVANDWPLWHVEHADEHAIFVADGAPRRMKQALVELEDAHDVGQWWNLDLITAMDEGPQPWHGSPERPTPRDQPGAPPANLLTDFDWSTPNR